MNRQRSQPLIMALQKSADEASKAYLLSGNESYKDTYKIIVNQMIQIKEAIIQQERKEHD